ncbi:hypothetical protein HGG64_00780 [Mycoplasma phocoeninasale]|uniref:Variable surface lipoprotein n=1 Tax=Mycoplasma phocoeninasale TaxID=2726117 RepID=A0A858U2H9_9MOLU|nr:hypothetical protein [Mycoplasma phocoeninasale]QJG66249.1 hypothetical protein HGG64_00780 [Mycoplasma phocoeninasale]
MMNLKNKKKIVLITLGTLSIIPLPLAAACTNTNTKPQTPPNDPPAANPPANSNPGKREIVPGVSVDITAYPSNVIYLSLYYLHRVEYIKTVNKKDFPYIGESKQILEKLLEVEKTNDEVINNGISFINDFKKYAENDPNGKNFESDYIDSAASRNDKKYQVYLDYLINLNYKFREIQNGAPKPNNHIKLIKHYWNLLKPTRHDFWSLFYIKGLIEEYINLKENDMKTVEELKKVLPDLENAIAMKQALAPAKIANINLIIEPLKE